MKRILIIFALLLASLTSYSQLPKQLEKYYTNKFASIIKGKTQQYIPLNKRYVDIVTDTLAIEVEFANKFLESIGQSLDYAVLLNKKPCILLIVNGKNDENYLAELMRVNVEYQLKIRIYLWDYTTDKWCKVDEFHQYSYSYQF